MKISTRAQGFEMTEAIDQFTQQQLGAALHRFSVEITSISVFMRDANGPKGGIDKQVLVRIRLRSRQEIVPETEHENLYTAIKRGSGRARRVVRRQLRKYRRIRKLRMRGLVDQAHLAVATTRD